MKFKLKLKLIAELDIVSQKLNSSEQQNSIATSSSSVENDVVVNSQKSSNIELESEEEKEEGDDATLQSNSFNLNDLSESLSHAESTNNHSSSNELTTNSGEVTPTDFSIKSRALYESFRGKINTIERRPLNKKSRSALNSIRCDQEAKECEFKRQNSNVSSNSCGESVFLNESSISLPVAESRSLFRDKNTNNVVIIDKALRESMASIKRPLSDNKTTVSVIQNQETVIKTQSPRLDNNLIGQSIYK